VAREVFQIAPHARTQSEAAPSACVGKRFSTLRLSGINRLPEDGKKGQATFSGKRKKSSQSPSYAFFIPASTRAGVNGASRRRTPVASKMALAMAAAIGALEGSPPLQAGIAGDGARQLNALLTSQVAQFGAFSLPRPEDDVILSTNSHARSLLLLSQFFIMVRLRIDTAQRGICVPGRK